MSLTRFDPAKGCFVLAGEKPLNRPDGCNCHPDSPFLWAHNIRDSFAMEDRAMRTQGQAGLSKSHAATLNIERLDAQGKTLHLIKGIGKRSQREKGRVEREDALLKKRLAKEIAAIGKAKEKV
jgi:hypothetical protein